MPSVKQTSPLAPPSVASRLIPHVLFTLNYVTSLCSSQPSGHLPIHELYKKNVRSPYHMPSTAIGIGNVS